MTGLSPASYFSFSNEKAFNYNLLQLSTTKNMEAQACQEPLDGSKNIEFIKKLY